MFFPDYSIPPKEYVNVVEKESKFRKSQSNPFGIIGDLGFGLNKRKEVLQLFTAKGEMVDSVGYLLEPTDSIFTYSLMLPELDNGNEDNWEQLKGSGTPGSGNPSFIEARIAAEQRLWMRIGAASAMLIVLSLLVAFKAWQKRRSSY